jgi:xylan 1,4-beta-xylosidase
VVKNPFYGGFGLIAADRIAKPAFNAFAMLHKLGDTQLPLKTESALATRRADGTVVLALWNYAAPLGDTDRYTPGAPAGPAKHFEVDVKHLKAGAQATVWRLDQDHGNAVAAFDKMGRPDWPSREQIKTLREAGQLAAPEQAKLAGDRLSIDVPPQGLVVIELR